MGDAESAPGAWPCPVEEPPGTGEIVASVPLPARSFCWAPPPPDAPAPAPPGAAAPAVVAPCPATLAAGLTLEAGLEAPSSPPTSPANGQSLTAWSETSMTKAMTAAAIRAVPETAPKR